MSVDDVPADFVAKEKEIEMAKEDLASKPPQIREKIVEGRVAKRVAELALLEQAYIRDDKVLVKDHVKEASARLGEKIQVGAHSLVVLTSNSIRRSGPEASPGMATEQLRERGLFLPRVDWNWRAESTRRIERGRDSVACTSMDGCCM